jgi:DNA gyrase subunit A
MKVANISEQGRATQGVKLIRIDEGDEIAAITKLDVDEEEVLAIAEGVAETGTETIIGETTNSPENTSEGEETTPTA